jgi:K+-sensing histidine kinase KdpD
MSRERPEQEEEQALGFSTVIASTVHDMKNSLGMLMQAHAALAARLPAELGDSREQGIIEYESMRLNGMLVQMLGLYKLGVNQLPLQPAHIEVEDFFQASLARHDNILRSRQISGTYEVAEDGLMGFFDAELVDSVVGNVINNSIRYARSAIHLRAWMEDEQLVLAISDDGQGYPQRMLDAQSDYVLGINMSSGSTGLGLYFGARIAERHQRHGVQGRIAISNDSELGGGEFRIYLP